MNHDFRITVGFFFHPKTLRLQSELGDSGILALIRLWEHTAAHRWGGVLMEYTPRMIGDVVRWADDPRGLVDALVHIGFLDKVDGGYLVHDWPEHNPYCTEVEQRIERARKAAEVRWKGDAASNPRSNAGSNAGRNASRNAPDPSRPVKPTRKPRGIKGEKTADLCDAKRPRAGEA